ncbi:MAG: bifunctional phosphopantothenoylcysteine decarboxylase/phosphopantothenate--cysteine ligase CoaBC [Candidatus Sumerlaeia bacterium]
MNSALQGKKVLLGVTGSIACYKGVDLVSRLVKAGCSVQVLMTPTAAEFVRPLSFESITQRPVYLELTRTPDSWEMEHIEYARWGDLLLVAPATATTLARLACGLAGDAVSSTYLAFQGPVFVAPAMNHAMWTHSATQDNIRCLQARGVRIIMPESGRLACGEVGVGRLADIHTIVETLESFFAEARLLAGKRVVITSGPTREYIDPVRFLSNPSTGKMGQAMAEEAAAMGAEVVLITGPVAGPLPPVNVVHHVTTALDMLEKARQEVPRSDIAIFAAAVSDYRPAQTGDRKLKRADKDTLSLELIQNPDIAATLGRDKRPDQCFIGFAAETNDLETEARRKLAEKHLDFIVANPVGCEGAGFGADTNRGLLISVDGPAESIPPMTKRDMARLILRRAAGIK